MTKLNPCPNCGNEPDITEVKGGFLVGCTKCNDNSMCQSGTANGAMNGWNAATGDNSTKTLRDEFAKSALPLVWRSSCDATPLDDIAAMTYKMSDAMIKERNKCRHGS